MCGKMERGTKVSGEMASFMGWESSPFPMALSSTVSGLKVDPKAWECANIQTVLSTKANG